MHELNDDLLDGGLQAVMGKERCQNPEDWQKTIKERRAEKACSAEPVRDIGKAPARPRTALEKVKACTKWITVFALISGTLFYWQQAGLLDSRAAVPSLILCALGAGLTVGWHAK